MSNAVKYKFNLMSAPDLTQLSEPTLTASSNDEVNIEYFKACLKEYLKLDEEIKTLSKALKQRRDKQTTLSQSLLMFLNKNDIGKIQLEGNYTGQELLTDKVNKVKNPNATSILEIISAKLANNQELLKEITDEIEAHKESVEVEKVKISKIGAGSKKKKSAPAAEESALSNALLLGVQ
jgi:ferritin